MATSRRNTSSGLQLGGPSHSRDGNRTWRGAWEQGVLASLWVTLAQRGHHAQMGLAAAHRCPDCCPLFHRQPMLVRASSFPYSEPGAARSTFALWRAANKCARFPWVLAGEGCGHCVAGQRTANQAAPAEGYCYGGAGKPDSDLPLGAAAVGLPLTGRLAALATCWGVYAVLASCCQPCRFGVA